MTRKAASGGGGREKKPAASMAKANKTQAGSKADSPRAVFGQRATAPRSASGEDKASRRRRDDSDWEIRKRQWKPSTLLSPTPAIMVSCGGKEDFAPNIITLAWAGTVCSEPPMLGISIRPERYSYGIIQATKEFVVNVPTATLARATDYCGVKSGRDGDKFAGAGLTPMAAEKVAAPLIAECPINLECRVKKVIKLGSHDLFLAEILLVQVSEDILDKKGKLRIDKADLLAYANREYYVLGKRLGAFGYSIRKATSKSRR
ncbi:MAG: flavin reductase family protein [Lentisphaeria bacterium]|jgi:flavin reductase (DIM6/NTAB) family NADH-FMN oxidoreductase RutF